MPYSRVTRTAFGTDAIQYARGTGKGHDGTETRNQLVAGVNLLPDDVVSFEDQMQYYWDHASAQHKVQINRFIISFGPDELDADSPDDCMTALEIGIQFAKENAPDCQSAVFAQTDGAGHKLHLHILTNDVKITNFKGLEHSARHHSEFSRTVDQICSRFIGARSAELAPERVTPAVRGQRIANEKIQAGNEQEKQLAAFEGREPELIPEKYIWIDDLRERIKRAAAAASDEEEFARFLRLDGVELIPQTDKQTGEPGYRHRATKTQPEHYLFELVDTSRFVDKIPRNLKSKSHKLGTNYQPDKIAELFRQPGDPAPETAKEPLSVNDRIMAGLRDCFGDMMRFLAMETDEADRLFDEYMEWRVKVRRPREAGAGRTQPPIATVDEKGEPHIMRDELAIECHEFLRIEQDRQIEKQLRDLAEIMDKLRTGSQLDLSQNPKTTKRWDDAEPLQQYVFPKS